MPTDLRSPLTWRLGRRHWLAIDIAAACLLIYASLDEPPREPLAYGVPGVVAYLLAAALALPLAVRRLWPVPVFGVVLVASVAGTLLRYLPYPYVALALAIYPVATGLRLRWAFVALVGALAALTVAADTGPGLGPLGPLVRSGHELVAILWAFGVAIRFQRISGAHRREHEARRVVAEERLRIARELHDVIAHGMSLIAVQSGVARYVVDSKPDEAQRALAAIEETSRAGLHELRQLLSALRSDADGRAVDGGQGTDRSRGVLEPAPRLADLDALTTSVGAAGVPVTLEIRGAPRPLPSGVGLSAYRIVQEALTNVIKHAAPARATVVLDYRPNALAIEVTDDGRRRRWAESGNLRGHGLIGMRERAALYGGWLTVGPLEPPGTGFRVRALLPTGDGSA